MIKRLVSVAIGISSIAAASFTVGGCAHEASAPSTQPVTDVSNPHVQRTWLAELGLKNDRVVSIHARQDALYVYTDNNMVYVISRYGGRSDGRRRSGKTSRRSSRRWWSGTGSCSR